MRDNFKGNKRRIEEAKKKKKEEKRIKRLGDNAASVTPEPAETPSSEVPNA